MKKKLKKYAVKIIMETYVDDELVDIPVSIYNVRFANDESVVKELSLYGLEYVKESLERND